MLWTDQQKVAALLQLPWTISVEESRDGLVAYVREIPGVIATGETMKGLGVDLWLAMSAVLESLIADGDEIPVPPGARLPWDGRPAAAEPLPQGTLDGDGWVPVVITSSGASSMRVAVPA
jgi:predicted RNase H-like HicB family nuclease